MDSMRAISGTIRRTETPDGAVLLDVERGQMFSVNSIGSKILELVGKGSGEAAIAAQLSATYEADLEQVRADVHEFLEALSRHHILGEGGKAAHR
jgi:Coenzyme PQQ synthesis protein D (PqqD)